MTTLFIKIDAKISYLKLFLQQASSGISEGPGVEHAPKIENAHLTKRVVGLTDKLLKAHTDVIT